MKEEIPQKHKGITRFFFFNDTATTENYTLSLHDALPICVREIKTMGIRKRCGHARGGRKSKTVVDAQ